MDTIGSIFIVTGYFWGVKFFTAITKSEVHTLVVEGRRLILNCPDDIKPVFTRPNGHAVHTDTHTHKIKRNNEEVVSPLGPI